MAKKRKGKKTHHRRRRVGAASFNANNPLVKYGSIAVGFLLADKINGAIDKATNGKIDEKLLAAGEGGLGAALVFMKLGKKKTTVQVVAGGVLLGAGLKRGLKSFGILSGIGGYGSVPVLGRHRVNGASRVNGYGAVPVLGAYRSPGQVGVGAYKAPGQVNAASPVHMKVLGSTRHGSNHSE